MKVILFICIGIIIIEIFRYYFGFQSFLKRQKVSWIGFDLDGTLATKDKRPFNPRIIGEPVSSTISLIKEYIDKGENVKILTARVSTDGTIGSIYNAIVGQYVIRSWCKKHIGHNIDIVSVKDFKMKLLYDDSVIQVKSNTGELVQ